MAGREKLEQLCEEEYLALDRTASAKYEFIDGNVFAMAGATRAHSKICGNIFHVIRGRLGEGPCEIHMNDMKLRIESANSYYYPDIIVSCEPFDPKAVFIENPIFLAEVLSPSTMQIDRREKLIAYKKIASLQEYLVVYQDRQRLELFSRSGKNWEKLELSPREGNDLTLQSLPCGTLSLPFRSIYAGYEPPSIVKESEGIYETAKTSPGAEIS